MHYPSYIQKLVQQFRRLPGVGQKTAERYAFNILDWKPEQAHDLAKSLDELPSLIQHCKQCGCLMEKDPCRLCDPQRRDPKVIAVVASIKDVFAIEETGEYRNQYHVLGGLLSPLEGRGPECLSLDKLKSRIAEHEVHELLLALDSTLEGDATALFIKREFADLPVEISRLAFGLPMGSALDYVDGGTLAKAMSGRNLF
ncbi:MAG: recombination protein RecR [Waddliaceae bacterium]|nr:recombination protein RecR [Waddliaceae bacterium]